MLNFLLKPVRFFQKKTALRYKKKLKGIIGQKKFEPLPNTAGKPPLFIVTLTSYGRRTEDTAPYAIWSLFEQSVKPDKIVLWLDEDKWNLNNIPELLKTEIEMGLEIRFCKDIKSYTKLNHALKCFPNDVLVTVDDDIYYPKDWLELLLKTHRENPQKICCHRAHAIRDGKPYNKWKWRASVRDNPSKIFPTGVGGILYPPNSLATEYLEEAMALAPHADDIAYWALAKMKGTGYCLVEGGYFETRQVDGFDESDSLIMINVRQGANDRQMDVVLKRFWENQ